MNWLQGCLSLLLLYAACRCTVVARFVQFRRFGRACRGAVSSAPGPGGVTTAQATATALAATVGTGNIAGVAGAVLLGGPGAVFWMWISALTGAAAKYLEISIAKRAGGSAPGPIRYMVSIGSRFGRATSVCYALLLPLCALCTGNLVQINTAAECAQKCAVTLVGASAPDWIALLVGLAAGLLALPALLSGARRIGRMAERIVPLMSGLYILCALVVLAANIARLPAAFGAILRGAWRPEAFLFGMARGMFSHESGFGTAALAHENAAGSPHTEGLCGVFEVFFDTIVMCSITALALLSSGAVLPYGDAEVSGSLMTGIFGTVFGERAAACIVCVSLLLFAFSSALTYGLYGGLCVRYLFGTRGEKLYLLIFCAAMPLGACLRVSFAWNAAHWAGYVLALVNYAALFLVLRRSGTLPSIGLPARRTLARRNAPA